MDQRSFDTLTRALVSTSGRRGFVATLVALITGMFRSHASDAQDICAGYTCNEPYNDQVLPGVETGECQCTNFPVIGACNVVQCHTSAECPGGTVCLAYDCGEGYPGVCLPASPVAGAASAECPSGQEMCRGTCVDIMNDTGNCGACGNACGGGEIPWGLMWACVAGTCDTVCRPDADYCGEECTDFTWDSQNCGACGNDCGPDGTCCGGVCVQRSDAERFCDSCGMFAGFPQGCNANEICDGGRCVGAMQPVGSTTYWVGSWTCDAPIDTTQFFEPPMWVAGPEPPFAYDLAVLGCTRDSGITYALLDDAGNEVGSCTVTEGICWSDSPEGSVESVRATNLPEGIEPQAGTTNSVGGNLAIVFNIPAAQPEFVPEKGVIAYAVRDQGHWAVWAHDLTTGENTELANVPDSDQFALMYSHDGMQIAYVSDEENLVNQVFVMNEDGSDQRQITSHSGDGQIMKVAWLPEQDGLIVTVVDDTNHGLHRVDLASGAMEPYVSGWASSITIGNDGSIAFLTNDQNVSTLVLGMVDEPEAALDNVWQRARDLGAELLGSPRFSPEADFLAFDAGSLGQRHIEVARMGGGSIAAIPRSGADDSQPTWSPDHIWLAHVVDRPGSSDLVVVRVNGSTVTPPSIDLPSHDKVWYLSWRPVDSDT